MSLWTTHEMKIQKREWKRMMKAERGHKKKKESTGFHYPEYQEQIKEISRAAHAEYLKILIDDFFAQHTLIRNYVWTAAAVFAFDVFMLSGNSLFAVSAYPDILKALALASVVIAGSAFIFGVDTMRGRKNLTLACFNYRDFAEEAYEDNKKDVISYKAYYSMIDGFDKANRDNREIISERSPKLRVLSVLLSIAAALSFVALIFPFVESFIKLRAL